MSGILEATAIRLTRDERTELEGLARSTKTEHRLRQRARIILMAADGAASRGIGRTVGCTTGTVFASKAPDGSLSAQSIQAEKDGVKPLM